MASEGSKQKLIAILSADVKDYSRLMGQDRVGTIDALKSHRDLFSSFVKKYAGRVVDDPGDEILAAFESVSDTVNCAVEIQRELAERNAEVPSARMMQWRIGISLGEIIEEEGRIYGDGVNISARVQGLAIPGGICISGTVYDQVQDKLGLEYESLGEQAVKNIAKPVRVYRVLSYPGAAAHRVVKAKGEVTKRLHKVTLAVVAVAVLCVASVLVWNHISRLGAPSPDAPKQETTIASAKQAKPSLAEKPFIAVLPFDNLSNDPEQEYFIDGMTEEVITRLSMSSRISVISRNSTFFYKGKQINIKEIGEKLGARYVVEGSVRKAGDRIRVTAQLIEAPNDEHLWAKTYEREYKDIFALQDEIAQQIASALGLYYTEAEMARSKRIPTDNLTAYESVMRGNWTYELYFKGDDPSSLAEARSLFERAIELDPEYAIAYSGLGFTYIEEWYRAKTDHITLLEKAEKAARKCLLLDRQLADGHLLMARIHQIRRETGEMVAAARRAIHLDPSSSGAYRQLGFCLAESGQPEKALEVLDRGMQLSPSDPWIDEFLRAKSRAYFAAEQYENAANLAKRSIEQGGNTALIWLDLAAAQAQMGQLDEARGSLRKADKLAIAEKRAFTLSEIRRDLSYVDETFNSRWFDGLRKAGFE